MENEYAQVPGFDEDIRAKDGDIESLKSKIEELETSVGILPTGPVLVSASTFTICPPEPVVCRHPNFAIVMSCSTHTSAPAH